MLWSLKDAQLCTSGWLHSQAPRCDTKTARGMKTQWHGLKKLKLRLGRRHLGLWGLDLKHQCSVDENSVS